MKKSNKIMALIIISITLFTSCNTVADKSDKFIGTWERIDKPEHPMIISKSGLNLIVQMPHFDAGDGRYRGDDKNSASYIKEQDKLELSVQGFKLDIIYDEKTNYLLFNGKEYSKKTKESDLLKLIEDKRIPEKMLESEKGQLESYKEVLEALEKSPTSPQNDESISNVLINIENGTKRVNEIEEEIKIIERKIENLKTSSPK
ncbi:MAG TPA: hypothetical protein VLB84_06835 [Bacteroidia bacterium]|nr:hypothetical protein [Bacteroidia bacterium]